MFKKYVKFRRTRIQPRFSFITFCTLLSLILGRTTSKNWVLKFCQHEWKALSKRCVMFRANFNHWQMPVACAGEMSGFNSYIRRCLNSKIAMLHTHNTCEFYTILLHILKATCIHAVINFYNCGINEIVWSFVLCLSSS